MKIFVIWPFKESEISILFSELEKNGHEVVYWVGLKEGEKYKPTGAVFHDHNDAWVGLPSKEVDASSFVPPDEELLKKLHKTESYLLTMMNKRYYYMSVDERKHFYYNMLQYWKGVIDKYKPDLIIFPTIPHTVYNYLIYELAILFNIKTVMFEDIQVGERILLYNIWEEGCLDLKKKLIMNKDKIFLLTDLSSDLQEYFNLQTKDGRGDATPPYMSHYKKVYTGVNFFRHKFKIIINAIKNGSILKRVLDFIVKIKKNPQKEYNKLQIKPDYSKSFVYIALCYQPERTTSPQGGVFVDQILMIETLSAALPEGWVLYVKEHPSQMWLNGLNYSSCRYEGYYKRIAQLKNTHIIPVETNSFELIKKSQAVATVTGTVGWEAALRMKPAIIFGYAWYHDCPGIFRVNSAQTCRQVFSDITNGFSIRKQDIINYLKSIDNVAVNSQIDRISGSILRPSKLSNSEMMTNITKAIIKNIKKIIN
ncbi:MAG: hypothetical protein WC323_00075 [Patescibacteria group bacterium]|jgi:hypothetical protein